MRNKNTTGNQGSPAGAETGTSRRPMVMSNAMAVVRRLRAGGPATQAERQNATLIRERLARGDLVTDAQVVFMELVERCT